MRPTRALWQHKPMIKFLGKRHPPKNNDHAPHAHPAAGGQQLPESFASYRNRATQHGPLGGQQQQQSQRQGAPSAAPKPAAPVIEPYGNIGGHSGRQLGPVQPAKGEVWDVNELPVRFRRRPFSQAEIEAVETAGASMWA
ncbi:hypothetical protein LTR37_019926 [Vermiconidia calcicola]|uniref:Uncharacterized protein n=1 Tax=Vermiconidia calcicola TaxID=1690605 RepID=A0ACC3MCS1_9PEZI|nr:hypothetical protein LTR37_019926 [Vermiconidia calcicola]